MAGAVGLEAQEPGLAAGLSKDPALIADYASGDHHMMFAIRTGLAPPDATAETHRTVRDNVKPISIGINSGMSKYGAAAQSKKSLVWAASAIAAHRHAYPVFTQWQHDMSTQARFDERISTVFGWSMAVHAETRRGTLLNFPMQANGAEMMRLAAIAAYEAGIMLAAPAHDAFWIMALLTELDTVETMRRGSWSGPRLRSPGFTYPSRFPRRSAGRNAWRRAITKGQRSRYVGRNSNAGG